MNFKDFYKDKQCRYSFEVFPPKNEGEIPKLLETLRELSSFDPSFISCTYGAMGTTQEVTRDLVIRIKKEIGLTTAFHFTCVGSGKEKIKEYVEHLKKEGIRLVVALRGDPPEGEQFIKPADGFSYANELVSYLKEINGFSLAVAGYPEGHLEAADLKTDLENLKRKVDAGADIVITQLFLDNRFFFDFVDRARKIGIDVPIIPGIMPIISTKQIEKITRICGVSLPESLHQQLSKFQDQPEEIRKVGIEQATEQCRELLEKGVDGIHFYILNKSYSIQKVLQVLTPSTSSSTESSS